MFNHFFMIRRRTMPAFFFALSLFLFLGAGASADDPNLTVDIPNRFVIPSLALDSPVVAVGRKAVVINGKNYTQWETSDDFVSWHNLSAGLGQIGNTVLAGHSDVYARVFENLKYVRIGDEIVVFGREQVYLYYVTQKFLVREKDVPVEHRLANARWIARTDDERLTMVTCANPGATHRLIIIARPAFLVKHSPD